MQITSNFILIAIGLLVALLVLYYVFRKFSGQRLSNSRKANHNRLNIVDALPIDQTRQLVLIQRDNTEHLVMIGGSNDLLIEQNITSVQARINNFSDSTRSADPSHSKPAPVATPNKVAAAATTSSIINTPKVVPAQTPVSQPVQASTPTPQTATQAPTPTQSTQTQSLATPVVNTAREPVVTHSPPKAADATSQPAASTAKETKTEVRQEPTFATTSSEPPLLVNRPNPSVEPNLSSPQEGANKTNSTVEISTSAPLTPKTTPPSVEISNSASPSSSDKEAPALSTQIENAVNTAALNETSSLETDQEKLAQEAFDKEIESSENSLKQDMDKLLSELTVKK